MIYVNPQQTLYMFDQTTAFMTTPPPVYKNYRFKTSGTLTVNMTTDPVDYYLIGGGGGGGNGSIVGNASGEGGRGGERINGTVTFSGVYTIVVGPGAYPKNVYSNLPSSSRSKINGPGLSVESNAGSGAFGGAYLRYNQSNGNNGSNGPHIGGLGAGGGGGSYRTNIGGSGGSIGGGNGGSDSYAATAGAANTGSGGGGGGYYGYRYGAAGGSGVVYIRLPKGKYSYTASYDEVANFGDTTAI